MTKKPHELQRRNSLSLEPIPISDPQSVTNPTLLVPSDVRVELGRLWACNAHLFPNQLPLFATVRDFLDQGLPVEAIPAIVRRLLSPDRRSLHRFPSDLLTDLAGLVVEEMRRRRIAQDQQDRARQHEADRLAAASGDEIHELLAGVGRRIEDSKEDASNA